LVKDAQCARCGVLLAVSDDFDLDEDMTVCNQCDYEMARDQGEAPWMIDTPPL
jgi:hypothetical protein